MYSDEKQLRPVNDSYSTLSTIMSDVLLENEDSKKNVNDENYVMLANVKPIQETPATQYTNLNENQLEKLREKPKKEKDNSPNYGLFE